MKKSTYITTSIAYVNAEPHIGFLLELVAADVLARFHRQKGEEVFFLTGTDEHGTKVEQSAKAAGKEPQLYTDEVSKKFADVCQEFNISNNYFIRTTNPGHVAFVQEAWQKFEQAGALEKRTYQGLYCTGCEAFKIERELVDGKCPIHEREVEKVEEENYFFLLTKYKQKVLDWLNSGQVIEPEGRLQEIKNILGEVEDVSVSRPKTKLSWGIPVPGDDSQVLYVWVDALLNYLSGITLADKEISDVWPADFQIIGKDIVKFHAVIWPALLTALGYELPKKLLVHGFVNIDGKKISKSLGNIVYPHELKDRYGVEATRYLLLRQLSFYDDSNFVWGEFDALYDGELANGLGNLVARSVGLAKKIGQGLPHDYEQHVPAQSIPEFRRELEEINKLISECDKTITETKLWEDTEKKTDVLQSTLEKIYRLSLLLEPFTPVTSKEIRRQLTELDPKPLFPRLAK